MVPFTVAPRSYANTPHVNGWRGFAATPFTIPAPGQQNRPCFGFYVYGGCAALTHPTGRRRGGFDAGRIHASDSALMVSAQAYPPYRNE